MNSFRVPDAHAKIFLQLSELNSDKLQSLFDSLKTVNHSFDLGSELDTATEAFEIENGFMSSDISKVAIPLHIFRFKRDDLSDAEFVTMICEDILKTLGLDNERLSKLQLVIVNLLECRNLGVSTQAATLAYDNHACVSEFGLTANLKPVFYKSDSKPEAFFIEYALKIEYRDNESNEHSLFTMLDEDDINKLEKLISKVRLQREALKALVSQTTIQLLEVKK